MTKITMYYCRHCRERVSRTDRFLAERRKQLNDGQERAAAEDEVNKDWWTCTIRGGEHGDLKGCRHCCPPAGTFGGPALEAGVNPKDVVGAKKLPILSIVPPASIIYEANAMRDGALKYGPTNWRDQKIQAMTYIDANLRHILAWVDGEDLAPDSLVHHLAHAKASLGILIDAIEHGSWIDNRPKQRSGVAAKLLAAAVRKP
jgi:hypothetical protein